MTYLLLGCRLALAGGRGRAALVALGNTVGVVVVLLATAVPGALPSDLSRDDRRLAVAVMLFLMLPVVSLLASVTRLSAGVRDRRLAALRLLGVDAARTRLVAATEALALSSAGVAAGVLAWVAAVRPAAESIDASWRSWFDGRDLTPPDAGWVVAVAGVPLLTAVVALAPVRRVTGSALAVRREGDARRPGGWRLVPLATGLAALGWAASRTHTTDAGAPRSHVVAFFAGAALTAVSLPLVVPVLVRLLADLGVYWGRGPATVLAARRLQQEPASSTRLVAALLVALFTIAGGRCVLTEFEEVPQYRRALRAATTGPQFVNLSAGPGSRVDRDRIRAVPGVRAAVPIWSVAVGCENEERPFCGTAFVGTCADLAALTYGVEGCRDDRPAWLDPGYQMGAGSRPASPRLEIPSDDGPSAYVDIGPATATLPVRIDDEDPNVGPPGWLFVPATTPGVAALLPAEPYQWIVVTDGGDQPVRALHAALGVHVFGEARDEIEKVAGYRAVLYAVAAVVLTVGLAALLVAGIDRAMERRRHLAALGVLGVPARVVRRSQLVQAVAPLLAGLPLAGGAGLLAGAAYLTITGDRSATPWPAVVALSGAAVAAGVLVAAATVAGLGGRVRAADLRRE